MAWGAALSCTPLWERGFVLRTGGRTTFLPKLHNRINSCFIAFPQASDRGGNGIRFALFFACPGSPQMRRVFTMATSMQTAGETSSEVADTIREVCVHTEQPAEIWDALDAKGIEATPGMVHQAIHDLTETEGAPRKESSDAKLVLDTTTGLTAEDIETLVALADKLGGVEALITALRAIKHAA
jgi:hypothetical protein